MKWVKAANHKSRTFPEAEDARHIYAASTQINDADAHSQPHEATAVKIDAQISTTGAATSDEAAQVQPAAIEEDGAAAAQTTGDAADGADASAAIGQESGDETQGGHLFDETMRPDVEADGDGAEVDAADNAPTTDVEMKEDGPSGAAAPAPEPQTAAGEEPNDDDAEDDDDAGQGEEEAKRSKNATIRIGGPAPESDPLAATDSLAEPALAPTAQVSSELHPPPDGADASADPLQVQSAGSTMEQDPAAAVGEGSTADAALQTITTTTRDDPEVSSLGKDVEAIVHEQPDGVHQVKVVVDDQ